METVSLPTARTGRIRIRLERSFVDFQQEARGQFLCDISRISGCAREEIQSVAFRSGCVVFEARMDRQAIVRLVELFAKRNDAIPGDRDLQEFRRLIEIYAIRDVSDQDSYRFTITASRKSASRKIIFVHGWRGDTDSFGKMPDFLAKRMDCESLIYDYPTGFWEKSPSIEFIGRNFENWIRNHAEDAKLAIVCHSMGGIVTRKFIVNQAIKDDPIDRNVKQITFVAAPHDGTGLAAMVGKLQIFRRVQTDEISPNSPFLLNVNEHWKHWATQNVPANCHARCIYGTADAIVPINSAASLDKDAVPILNADHIGIVKPINEDAEIVLTIARFLRKASF